MRDCMRLLAAAGMALAVSVSAYAQQAAQVPGQSGEIKRSAKMKEVQGQVTMIRKDKIAVVYGGAGTAEEEILLPIYKGTQLSHIPALDQIKPGDTVSIQFEEATEEGPQGVKTSRSAKAIRFIRQGQSPVEAPQAEPEPETSEDQQALISE